MKTCSVHLHVFDARHLTVEKDMLSDVERAEFGKLIHAEDRFRRMAFRCQLRRILARVIGGLPGDLAIETNAHGKPSVPGGPHFNLSHAGDLGVLAICQEAPVGVDIEPLTRGSEIMDCLETIAHADEKHEFLKLDPDEPGHALIRLWVAKEAALKAMGTGLSVEPSEFAITWSERGRARVEWGDGLGPAADEIHITSVLLKEYSGMEIAVALLGACPVAKIEAPNEETLVLV